MAHKPWHPGIARSLVLVLIIFRQQCASSSCRFAVKRPFCRRFGEPQDPRRSDLSVKLCQLECSQLSSCVGISHDGSDCDLWTSDCDFGALGAGNYSLMSKGCFRTEIQSPSFGRFSALQAIRRVAVVATGGINDVRLNALQLFAQQLRSGIGSTKYLLEIIPYPSDEAHLRHALQNDHVDAMLGPWGKSEDDQLLQHLADLHRPKVIVAGLEGSNTWPKVVNLHSNLPQHITEMLLRSIGLAGLSLALVSSTSLARHCQVAPQFLEDLGISVILNSSLDSSDPNWQGLADNLGSAQPDLLLVCLDDLAVQRLLTVMKTMGGGGFFPKALLLPTLDVARSDLPELTWSIGADCWLEGGPLTFRPSYSKAQFIQDYQRQFYASPPLAAAEAYAAAELMVLALEGGSAMASYPTVNTVLGRLDMSSTTPLTCATVQLLPAVSAGFPRVVTVGPDTYQAKDRDGPVYPAPSWQVRNCTSPTPRFYGWGFLADDCVLCAELLQESAWSSETQRRECRDCGAGETYIRLSEDQGSCFKSCNAGYFDSNGTCTSCAPGSFRSEGMAAHQCVACPAGRFSSEAAASCIPCMVGYAAPTLGMHSCEACRPGFFSALEGAKFCGACLEGHFSGAFASSRCEKCPAGTASKLTGSSVCEDCPPGSYSEGLRCTLCPVGQYQHLSRQTKCLEDGLGMLSPEPGLAVPSNTKHFFLLRYLNASRGTPPVQLERCMANPEVCLENEACEVGHSGRQCFACLPGFVRVTANSCSRCPDRFYGIFFATIYFFGYVLVIHMLMILADLTNLKDCHLMLLKILLNHCIAMAVLGSQMWRYLTEAGLFTSNATLQWLMELIVATDGAPQGEASWFSLSCLMQPPFASTPWIDRLANAKHHELEELQSERDDLAAYQYLNEVFVVLTWNALPVLVVLMSCIACCAILDRYMRSRMHLWPKAVDFYAKVSIFGSAVAHFWHVDSHTVYIQLARKRVLGLFWPLKYANSFARSSWPVLKHRTFLADHAPARTAVFHLMYFAVARRNLQVFTCEVLGEADPARVLRKQGAVECRVDDPLVATCIALAAMWAIVYPVVTMFFLRHHVKSQNRQASPSWAIQLNGYAVWWWEAVIYLRKLGFLLLELVPGSRPKIFCFTVCCLAALHAQEIYRPFDDRQGGLLNRIERYQLWSTLTPSLATLLAFELDNSRTSSRSLWSAIVVLCFVSHVLFIIVWIFHFFQNPLRRTAFWMAQWTPSAEKGWYLRNLILLSRSWWESSLRAQPYLAFHSLHGFVTVSGSGGDKALVPHLPQGHELPEVLLNSDEYRLRFSSVPSFLGEDIMPSSPSRLLVHKYLMSAVKYVVTNCHTISSSLLDFVLRAAFVLHKELVSAKQVRMVATDVARSILDRASEDKNPVLLRDEEEASESSDDETDAAKELHSKAAGRALEKELREHPEMLMEWQDFEDLKALAKELQAKGQGVTAKDLAIQHESQETPRTQVAPVDSVRIRPQQVDDVERTYRKKVSAMFSQWTFQHGMTLVDLRQGLALLRQVPPMELQVWLDAFERQWIPELLSSDRVIRRPAILEEEEAQAIKAVIESTFTGRAVTRRTRIQNVQMKKNWEVALEKEETKLEVALKWTRLLFWAYCGRFFVFKIAHLKCITQREKRQQQSFAATLQAPNLETMKLEPESQEAQMLGAEPVPEQLSPPAAPAVRHFEVKKSVLLASDQARARLSEQGETR